MLALRIEYLTGRVVATRYDNRDEAEWPPHPARVFSALVAAWAEEPDVSSDERAALSWLEQQGAPAISCSGASVRQVVTHFVPVNDPTLLTAQLQKFQDRLSEASDALVVAEADPTIKPARLQAARKSANEARAKYTAELHKVSAAGPANSASLQTAASLLPDGRVRQPRTFPSVTPEDPCVHLLWADSDASLHRAALDRLAARVTSLGHSASMVLARFVDEAPIPNWWPADTGSSVLRTVAPGQFERLARAWEQHQGIEGRILPFKAQRYREGVPLDGVELAQGSFTDEWLVFERADRSPLGLPAVVALARAMRGALMRHADQPVHEMISGHRPDGQPAEHPHLAILPLAHVGHRHADGGVMGIALVLPRHADDSARRALLRAVGAWEASARQEGGIPHADAPVLTVGLGNGQGLRIQRVEWGEASTTTLRAGMWCDPSRRWSSVTPVALDRNPGRLDSADAVVLQRAIREAQRGIVAACLRQGLPQPARIDFSPSPSWAGASHVAAFPAFPPGAGRVRRTRVHVHLEFDQPVKGPVLLGAGRFHGLGVFRPHESVKDSEERQA